MELGAMSSASASSLVVLGALYNSSRIWNLVELEMALRNSASSSRPTSLVSRFSMVALLKMVRVSPNLLTIRCEPLKAVMRTSILSRSLKGQQYCGASMMVTVSPTTLMLGWQVFK